MLRTGATEVPEEWTSGEICHIQMDKLLAKLRKNVVELILQGDEVTRKMWKMYAIFGEVFGRCRSPGKCLKAPIAKAPSSGEGTKTDGSNPRQESRPTTFLLPDTRIDVTVGSPSPRPQDRSPHSGKGRSYSCQRKHRGGGVCNPLLDTIGSLTPDPGDSDDSDGAYRHLRLRRMAKPKPTIPPPPPRETVPPPTAVFSVPPPPPQSDRESVGYAGSNSVDSGYKSLCATPEVGDGFGLPDVAFRSGSSTASGDDAAGTDSSVGPPQRRRRERFRPQQGFSPSRIKMGTNAISRKPPRNYSRGGTSPLSDVTLDHLMYLRQSLLSHVQTGGADGGGVEDEGCSSDTSRCQGDGIIVETEQHVFSVRNVTLCTSVRPTCEAEAGQRRYGLDDSDGDLEERYHLLGEAEYYDLESVEEFPCCYVTSPDSRKCRARRKSTTDVDFPPRDAEEQTSAYGSSRSGPSPPPPHVWRSSEKKDDRRLETSAQLTEAALCVLKMIEEFRQEAEVEKCDKPPPPPGGPRLAATSAVARQPVYRGPLPPRQPWVRGKMAPSRPGTTPKTPSCCSSDYHVYEEIVYDAVVDGRRARTASPPPPLPERPGERRHRRIPPKIPPPRLDPWSTGARFKPRSGLTEVSDRRGWVPTRDHVPSSQRVEYGFASDYPAS